MKRVLQVAFLVVAAATSSFGAQCVADNLTAYTIGGFVCEIPTAYGTVQFGNFKQILNGINGIGAGEVVPTNQITVNPLGAGSNLFGFAFGASFPRATNPNTFSVTGTEQYILSLSYTALVLNGPGVLFTQAFVNATAQSNGPQVGSASLTKDIFYGTNPAPDFFGPVSASANVNDVQVFSAPAVYNPPQVAFAARDLLTIQSNNAGASVSQFGNLYSQVPEPATYAMIGAGLLGLACARRRRQA
ncbi:MAG TPA: PEP-CTERM sorting domain-containing protein [Bryobacteraceae bacterium]|jgi:hypothetical protein|nr:PEP-CTERM sorting domain-containing protein [Bryobacteraceae bacterium]